MSRNTIPDPAPDLESAPDPAPDPAPESESVALLAGMRAGWRNLGDGSYERRVAPMLDELERYWS